MRMRRKRDFDGRFEKASALLIARADGEHDARLGADTPKMDLAQRFGNENPIVLDIGCGKGAWITKMATLYPDQNYIGVEKMSNVLLSAMETVQKEKLPNVLFANCGVEYLHRTLPLHFASAVYLNFSTPLPKSVFEKQRLTYKRFLTLYQGWLKPDGVLRLKTDDRGFFAYSICSLSAFGCTITNVSADLHKDDFIPNVATEHENKFAPLGPIYYLEARFPESK